MRHARFALLVLFVPVLAGCADSFGPGLASAWPPAFPLPVAAAPPFNAAAYEPAPLPAPPYALDTGDRLRVVVFGQENLTNSYAVDSAGNIALPLIGSVPARGRTTGELAGAVAARLRNGFLREPHVAIEVEAYRPFFILGEVTFPGQYPYVSHMTAETAVAIAGGFTPRAFRRTVEVSRPVGAGIVRETIPASAPIRPGDTIVVSERWF